MDEIRELIAAPEPETGMSLLERLSDALAFSRRTLNKGALWAAKMAGFPARLPAADAAASAVAAAQSSVPGFDLLARVAGEYVGTGSEAFYSDCAGFCALFNNAALLPEKFQEAASFYHGNVEPKLNQLAEWRHTILSDPDARVLAESFKKIERHNTADYVRVALKIAHDTRLTAQLRQSSSPADESIDHMALADAIDALGGAPTDEEIQRAVTAFRRNNTYSLDQSIKSALWALPDRGHSELDTLLAEWTKTGEQGLRSIFALFGREFSSKRHSPGHLNPSTDPVDAIRCLMHMLIGFFREGAWKIDGKSSFMSFDFLETDPAHFTRMLLGNAYEAHHAAALAAGSQPMEKSDFMNRIMEFIQIPDPEPLKLEKREKAPAKNPPATPEERLERRSQLLEGLSLTADAARLREEKTPRR